MSQITPWVVFERQYIALFTNPREGKRTKSVRISIGALIIKRRYSFSDEDTVEEIRENPCLQYFLSFAEYTNARAFNLSVMIWFRERITTEMLAGAKDYITDHKKLYDEEEPASDRDKGDGDSSGDENELGNQSQLTPRRHLLSAEHPLSHGCFTAQ